MSDAPAPPPLNAACPRCGGEFRCGARDASCACFGLDIDPVLRARIRTDYGGEACLCVACLLELQQAQRRAGAAGPGA